MYIPSLSKQRTFPTGLLADEETAKRMNEEMKELSASIESKLKERKDTFDPSIIQPLFDRVVVKSDPTETKTSGGIVVPVSAETRNQRGTVVSVGAGKKDEPMTVKAGDRVIYGLNAGTEIKVMDEVFLIMKESEIFAIIAEKRNE